MESLETLVAQHQEAITNIKDNLRDTEGRLKIDIRESEERAMRQIRDVQDDMRAELVKHENKLDNIDRKIDGAFSNLRKSVPTWASVVIALLGVMYGLTHGGW